MESLVEILMENLAHSLAENQKPRVCLENQFAISDKLDSRDLRGAMNKVAFLNANASNSNGPPDSGVQSAIGDLFWLVIV